MSCVQRRNPAQGEDETPGAQILCWVFAAVKKTAPSSREAIGPEVPDACILLGVFWCLPMNVPRMRLCKFFIYCKKKYTFQ